MRYTIEGYDSFGDTFRCRGENGKVERLDLFTDSTFPEGYREIETVEERNMYYRSLVGTVIDVESIFPYVPCYFASNVKIVHK